MSIISEFTGKSVKLDRQWLLGQVNEIRRAAWKQEATRQLYFRHADCECVECHYDDCVRCCGQFSAITLPQNVTNIQFLAINNIRIDVVNTPWVNGWCCSSCGCLKAQIEVNRQPLKRPLPPRYLGRLRIQAVSSADKGGLVGVKYVNRLGQIKREDIALNLQPGAMTSDSPSKVLELTFPERCGYIQVMTEDGYELGSYHPAIHSPSHLRIRLQGVRPGDLIQWEGFVEPHDLYFDTDQVEWSNPLDWKNQWQFLDLHFKTGKSPAERYAYEATANLAAAGAQSELQASQGIPAATLRPQGIQNLRNRIRRLQSRPYGGYGAGRGTLSGPW